MRDFFINLLEKLINVFVVIALLAVVGGAVMASMAPQEGVPGVVVGLAVLVVGFLYVVLMAGFMYLGLGIYQNTRRTAAAMEDLARR